MLYAIPTTVLVPVLLALLFGVTILGARRGRRRSAHVSEAERAQVSALQASLMGLLALLVGFSFSLALSRFDDHSVSVVNEANAIGTTWLRSDLLAGTDRDALRSALADYAASRLKTTGMTLTDEARYDTEVQTSAAVFRTAWKIAADANRIKPNEATGAVVSALNDMIDSFSVLDANLHRHVPEAVLYLLIASLLFLGWVIGLSAGENGMFPPLPVMVLMVLIVLLLALIFDLDRPRRGMLTVDQTPLVTTATQILTEAGRAPLAGN